VKNLFNILKTKFGMPDDQIKDLLSIGKEKKLAPYEYFIEAGTIPKKLAFVIFGLFRYVYNDDKGMEYTKGLIPEYGFISSYSAMITESPSYFAIEALEESLIFEFSYMKWLEIRESNPYWYKFLLALVEKGYITKEKRERELLLLDAETRYKDFLRDYPGMDKRIKQHIIASFLGIQPESLSRIRKKLIS
jgi:CRP-like cAMP-binding protein